MFPKTFRFHCNRNNPTCSDLKEFFFKMTLDMHIEQMLIAYIKSDDMFTLLNPVPYRRRFVAGG